MCEQDEFEKDPYDQGYHAFKESEPFDSDEEIEWQRGWMDAEEDTKESLQAELRRNKNA